MYSEISMTGKDRSLRNRNVPPVEIISIPAATSAAASSSKPSLFETLTRARFIKLPDVF